MQSLRRCQPTIHNTGMFVCTRIHTNMHTHHTKKVGVYMKNICAYIQTRDVHFCMNTCMHACMWKVCRCEPIIRDPQTGTFIYIHTHTFYMNLSNIRTEIHMHSHAGASQPSFSSENVPITNNVARSLWFFVCKCCIGFSTKPAVFKYQI